MNVLKQGILCMIVFNLCIVRTVIIYESCKQAYERSCDKKNGVYNIKTTTDAGYSEIYCVLEDPADSKVCPGIGWSPAIYDPANETQTNNLNYDSPHWTGSVGLNVEGGKTFHNLTTQALLPTFWSTSFTEICLRDHDLQTWLVVSVEARSLRTIFTKPETILENANFDDWIALRSDMQEKEFGDSFTKVAFNQDLSYDRLRFGISHKAGAYQTIGIAMAYSYSDGSDGLGLDCTTTGGAYGMHAYSLYVR